MMTDRSQSDKGSIPTADCRTAGLRGTQALFYVISRNHFGLSLKDSLYIQEKYQVVRTQTPIELSVLNQKDQPWKQKHFENYVGPVLV